METNPKISKRYWWWLGAAVCHLILMTLGASYVDLSGLPVVGKPLDYYGVVSGAGNTYGFFAPGITGQFRALFDVLDERGKVTTVSLFSGSSHEADLRLGDMIDHFSVDNDRAEEIQRSLAASFAGTIFGQHPTAKRVTVRLEQMLPVSMAEYREGQRNSWEPLYSAAFERRTGGSND